MRPETNGALAALTVVALSMLVMLAITVAGWVFAADHSSLRALVDVTVLAWLGIHLVPLQTAGGVVWLPPLVLTGALVWLAFRVGKVSMRRGTFGAPASRWRLIAAAAGVYALLAALLAAAVNSADVRASLWVVAAASALVFSVGFAPAIASTSVRWRTRARAIPSHVGVELRAALLGLGFLLMVGGAVVLASLVASWGDVTAMASTLRPGLSGTFVLLTAGVVYLPTAAVWAASYLLGVGFTIGSAGQYSPVGVTSTDVPSFPLLAAVPDAWSWWHLIGLLVPMLAGMLTAMAIAWDSPGQHPRQRTRSRLRAAAMAAVLAGVASGLAQGTLGGRLSDLGPDPVLCAIAVFGWYVVGMWAVFGLELLALRRTDSTRSAGPRPTRGRAGQSRGRAARWHAQAQLDVPSDHGSDSRR